MIPFTLVEISPEWSYFGHDESQYYLYFVPALYQLNDLISFQTLFLKNRKMNRRQYEILIYNDCLYRNMYRLDFHFYFLMLIKLSHEVQVHRRAGHRRGDCAQEAHQLVGHDGGGARGFVKGPKNHQLAFSSRLLHRQDD